MPAADEQTRLCADELGLVPIGWVQSALKVLDDAPNQREGAPRAWIRFDEQVAEGAKDLRPGDEIVVLTWLRLSRRDELSTHPEDDMSQPLTGVFSTCSPSRPNPIGLHRARIVAHDGLQIEVDALEAIDGTPVVDIMPIVPSPRGAAAHGPPRPRQAYASRNQSHRRSQSIRSRSRSSRAKFLGFRRSSSGLHVPSPSVQDRTLSQVLR